MIKKQNKINKTIIQNSKKIQVKNKTYKTQNKIKTLKIIKQKQINHKRNKKNKPKKINQIPKNHKLCQNLENKNLVFRKSYTIKVYKII
jgi:hypothetical protein